MKAARIMISLTMVISLLLTACGKAESQVNNGEQSKTPEATSTSSNNQAETAEDPFGKYSEPVIITIGKEVPAGDSTLPAGDTVEDNQFTRYFEEKLNIKFKADWIAASGDPFKQKLALAISSNDLPDMMVVGEKEFRAMVKAGQLEDLTEVYEKYAAPHLKEMYDLTKGEALKGATSNGKLLALPNLNVDEDFIQLLWLRQDWMDKLKLSPPKTVDELEVIMKAFIEDDPDGNGKPDTMGLVGDDYNSFQPVYGAYNAHPFMWHQDDAGKVYYGTTAPEMKEAVAKLRDWYEKGLLDKEYAVRKNVMELVNGGSAGMFLFGSWSAPWAIYDSIKNDPEAEWKAYALPLDRKGEFNANQGALSSQYFVVKKGYSNPEALVKYMNLYSNIEADAEATAQLYNGVNAIYFPLRATFAEPNIVTRRLADIKKALDGQIKTEDLDAGRLDVYNKIIAERGNPRVEAGNWTFANAYIVGGGALEVPMNKVSGVFYSQTKSMELKWPALQKMEQEMITKIIMGREPLEYFDRFVEEWKKSGGEQIMKEIEEMLNDK
ncbi:extracellular solute-binding protein [Paenibacillus sp. strain BS8-2]